ncbi:hypothetical protein OAK07_01950 [Marine Group III euryarchaeote]|nr:hypothetical protein [Marine Group III euryarchaeote]|tara:strand:- start:177 stop:314 length:138 start_codon:yes stop_codon:yes gene_type:complete
MIFSLITSSISAVLEVILALIPKKVLLLIVLALIAAIYIGFDFNL